MIRSALLGTATDLRSTIAPTMLSRAQTAPPALRKILHTTAADEMIADKLPDMPSRLEPGPLIARFVIGALADGVLAGRHRTTIAGSVMPGGAVPGGAMPDGAVLGGAMLDGTSALADAFADYHARRALTHGTNLPDLAVALIENVLAITAAHRTASDPSRDA